MKANKYLKTIADRIERGGCPVGYSPYNDLDFNEEIGTISCQTAFVGHAGNFVIFEEQCDEDRQDDDEGRQKDG